MELADLIKAKRLEKKLSLTRMSKLLGISSQRLGYYETGRNKPKIDFLERWKSVFNEDLIVTNVTQISYKEQESENILLREEEKPISGSIASLIRIIEKQQETIHYLTTGKDQGGDPLSKKAFG